MLFNSETFLFYFLPLTLLLVTSVRLVWPALLSPVLAVTSAIFYSWFSLTLLAMLLVSIAFNFLIAHRVRGRPWIFRGAVALNLLPLVAFKYLDLLGDTASKLAGYEWSALNFAIPLGISFYTLQQVGYLFDVRNGDVEPQRRPVDYFTYVAFFPQLIAGPIVRAANLFPQLTQSAIATASVLWASMALGFTWFVIGLFKKVVLADGVAPFVDELFERAAVEGVSAFYAWVAAFGYGLQLYFDFSGYSTMAVGLGLMIGLSLPFNFDTPYRSKSPQEFWRRWHITLSLFLRDQLYIPLGGNRHGAGRMAFALMVTMVIGGLWHGAGAQYAAWGAYHGALLIVAHAVFSLRARAGSSLRPALSGSIAVGFAWVTTLMAVMLGWLMFRAPTLDIAVEMMASALSVFNPLNWGALFAAKTWGGFSEALVASWPVAALLVVAIALPDVPKLIGTAREQFVSDPIRLVAACALLLISLRNLSAYSPFLYFQF